MEGAVLPTLRTRRTIVEDSPGRRLELTDTIDESYAVLSGLIRRALATATRLKGRLDTFARAATVADTGSDWIGEGSGPFARAPDR